MKLKIKILGCLFLMGYSFAYGQTKKYDYKREIKGISEQWHKIELPDEIFGEISQGFDDIRIFGTTPDGHTIEAPYILRLTNGKIINKEISFKTLNVSHTEKGYYFTFEIPSREPINQIKLNFNRNNFNWRIRLAGSQNLEDWYTLVENYRILSIKNESTDYQFTRVTLPRSKYRYYRLFIRSPKKPQLASISILQHEISGGTLRDYTIKKLNIHENEETEQTVIDVKLPMPVPVSYVKIDVKNTFEYYRPVTIKVLADSIKTEQGWIYDYRTLTTGILNSTENNAFKFNSTITQKLKIIIHNQDNQPLTIDSVVVKGYVHALVVRFTEQAHYFLAYGNEAAASPHYDIARFTDKIPAKVITLKLGNEQEIEKEKTQTTKPIVENKVWLWVIMGLIIVLLGWFSIKMMRRK